MALSSASIAIATVTPIARVRARPDVKLMGNPP